MNMNLNITNYSEKRKIRRTIIRVKIQIRMQIIAEAAVENGSKPQSLRPEAEPVPELHE